MAAPMISTPSAICSSVTMNGGARRKAVGVTPLTTSPRSRQRERYRSPCDRQALRSELYAEQQTPTSDMVDGGHRFEQRRNVASCAGDGRCIDAFQFSERCSGCGEGERLAGIGRSVITGDECCGDVVAGPHRSDRHPVGDALGHRDHVGAHAGMLETEPGTGAAHAGLHLVEDQQQTALVADLPDATEIVVVGRVDATFALHRLEDDTAHLGGEAALELCEVVPDDVPEPSGNGWKGSCFSG